jgi:lipid-binding SYLF domain-containing protein
MNEISDDDWEEYMKNRLQERREKAVQASTRIQINKEYALKRKAMSRWMFGQFHLVRPGNVCFHYGMLYANILASRMLQRSPRFSEELFPDVPLPSSFAEPYNPETNPPVQIKERVYGQNLYGDMIPQREVHVDSLQLMSSKQSVFLDAGLGSYFDDAYGWAQFMNVSKVAYGIGYGTAKGEVFAKTTGTDAKFVGSSTLMLASAGWSIGATLASEIIFFQNVDAFNRFKSGNFSIEGGAKVNILSLTAGAETGSKTKTTGVPFIDRLIESKTKGGNGEEKRRYQNGTVTFVIVKVGMMFDMSVVGQKFSFHPAGTT